MSTRSFVETVNESTGQFRGRYVHSDGYPTWMGPTYTNLLARFDGGLELMLAVLTEDNYGWSSINGRDEQELSLGYTDGRFRAVPGIGVAYTTEQDQSSPDEWVSGTLNASIAQSWGTEWGYLFTTTDPATAVLVVVTMDWVNDTDFVRVVVRIPVRDLHLLTPAAWQAVESGDLATNPADFRP